jgi:D-glycero-beta-D-manno-heptose 1-phosphate adenylyltransferase
MMDNAAHSDEQPNGADGTRPLVLRWRGPPPTADQMRPVVATGAFDIVNAGHVRFLAWAAAQARPLWVGIEDDGRVAYWKGPGRPVNPVSDRAEVLGALRPVAALFVISGDPAANSWEDYVQLLRALTPAALAFTAGDPHRWAKRRGAAALGAEGWEFPLQAGYSSSRLLERRIP